MYVSRRDVVKAGLLLPLASCGGEPETPDSNDESKLEELLKKIQARTLEVTRLLLAHYDEVHYDHDPIRVFDSLGEKFRVYEREINLDGHPLLIYSYSSRGLVIIRPATDTSNGYLYADRIADGLDRWGDFYQDIRVSTDEEPSRFYKSSAIEEGVPSLIVQLERKEVGTMPTDLKILCNYGYNSLLGRILASRILETPGKRR